jgi:CRISPR system Cascade subunit CasA
MKEAQFSFRIDVLPAVPVRWADGESGPRAVSLREALVDAHRIKGVDLEVLAHAAVMTRVLTPLILDVFGVPDSLGEWVHRWAGGRFDQGEIDRYFHEHGHRFDLFHPERPFDQVAGLRTPKDELKPVTVLFPAAASGNNVPLWSARTDAEPPALSPMEAFAALEVAQAFDTAAIKTGAADDPRVKAGKTSGNPVGTLGQIGLVMPRGRNLFETILLNTPAGPRWMSDDDAPHWRRPTAGPQWDLGLVPTGLTHLLTWQARRIRLVPGASADGQPLVRQAVLTAGDRLHRIPEWDPRTRWRKRAKPTAGQGAHAPVRHQAGRTGWRSLSSLLAVKVDTADETKPRTSALLAQVGEAVDEGHIEGSYPLDVLSVGVEYGNQSAVVESVIADSLPVPVQALIADSGTYRAVIEVAEQAETIRTALDHLEADLRRSVGAEPLAWDKGSHPGDQIVQVLEGPVRELLMSLRARPEGLASARLEWERAAWALAQDQADVLLGSAPPEAFGGRTDRHGRINTTLARRRFDLKVRRTLTLAFPQDKAGERQVGQRQAATDQGRPS